MSSLVKITEHARIAKVSVELPDKENTVVVSFIHNLGFSCDEGELAHAYIESNLRRIFNAPFGGWDLISDKPYTVDDMSFMDICREFMPKDVYDFVVKHEYNSHTIEDGGVYGCSLEDITMIADDKDVGGWIDGAISWANYVINYGDYDTREEFHHGTEEEWDYEVKKCTEWIALLMKWKYRIIESISSIGIHYIITSYGLIPEVSLYKTKEEARKAWFDNLEDNIEEIEESWESGFAEYDDYEFRYGMELVE